ncbi:hypothetical protein THAOC_31605 [Thalassiosira oceanica]|uniref:MYND-type domain-containing protein n=1 Tax=Thalassiosira oceanica TaxID=159749 RepID=K0RS49_THAOC|nr:hypothetical protein THAOC_31605 [Thalassiosira oceanica]|eukprot:EJK49512.1 hypothetical protein THAOC_31605 [Thalassiosira oceanica]
MSGDQAVDVCANCGTESSDAVKLKKCNACHLVKYCSVGCQKAHRKQHKGACKKRAAELKDEQLYGQGLARSERDSCPICTLPIPFPLAGHSRFFTCCMKMVCYGCGLAAQKRGMLETCPFCRSPLKHYSASTTLARVQARVDANDPDAISFLANQYCMGGSGLQVNAPRAVELWTKAAEFGSTEAHFELGTCYSKGEGVAQDKSKAHRYFELAAMQGHVIARHYLGNHETAKGNPGRSVRHYLISAKMGLEASLETIKSMFVAGQATKMQYAEALRGYQAAIKETKSPERDEAKPIFDRMRKSRQQQSK